MAVPTQGTPSEDDVMKRYCGVYTTSAQHRHRLHLQNLARRKALEKEAAALRDVDPELERLENGFRIHYQGANRSPKRRAPLDAWRKAGQPSDERPLRVPGAVPVEARRTTRRIVAPTPKAMPATDEQSRRTRRQWVVGTPVCLLTEDGEVLELHRGGWGCDQ